MRRGLPWVLLALLGAAFWLAGTQQSATAPNARGGPPVTADDAAGYPDAVQETSSPSERVAQPPPRFLPPEAVGTLALIQQGGPFPHRQDGGVFGNREGRLPRAPRGWYREYTVETPGLEHRGARRIVTGGTPPSQWYYSDDHYDSFRRFEPKVADR